MKRASAALAVAAALLAASPVAGEEDASAVVARGRDLPDRPGPPAMPGLSHGGLAVSVAHTLAVARPTDVTSAEPIADSHAYAYSGCVALEAALAPRRWYLGLGQDLAAAAVPAGETPGSGGRAAVVANPELWGRGLWSSASGLSAGGGLGVVVPVPRSFSSLAGEVVRAVRTIVPSHYPHFQDLTLTARPFLDIRHLVGPVTLQMRQGVDVSVLLRPPQVHEHRYDLTAIADLYAGLALGPTIVGLALGEVYQLTADVASPSCFAPCDEHRSQLTLSPSLRLALGRVTPAVSAMLPLSTPLRREVEQYYALRAHLDVSVPY
jgi:hypothetical protein